MIKIVNYTDIHRAIVKRLKSKFNDIVFSTDIEKAITRPSFFVDFDNIKASDFMNEALDREITVRIYYFPTTANENKIEILNMKDNLIGIFLENNLITLNEDIKIEIEEVDLSVVDKVLHCYFDIRISENYNRIDDTSVMEELEIDSL